MSQYDATTSVSRDFEALRQIVDRERMRFKEKAAKNGIMSLFARFVWLHHVICTGYYSIEQFSLRFCTNLILRNFVRKIKFVQNLKEAPNEKIISSFAETSQIKLADSPTLRPRGRIFLFSFWQQSSPTTQHGHFRCIISQTYNCLYAWDLSISRFTLSHY